MSNGTNVCSGSKRASSAQVVSCHVRIMDIMVKNAENPVHDFVHEFMTNSCYCVVFYNIANFALSLIEWCFGIVWHCVESYVLEPMTDKNREREKRRRKNVKRREQRKRAKARQRQSERESRKSPTQQ